jgi:hypothetical protein
VKNLKINESISQAAAAACGGAESMFASAELNDFAIGGAKSIVMQ